MSGIALQASAGGTAAVTIAAPEVNSPVTSTLPSYSGSVDSSSVLNIITATGTSINVPNLPADIVKLTIFIKAVSTTGTANWLLQLGTAGGITATGYLGRTNSESGGTSTAWPTNAATLTNSTTAGDIVYGSIKLTRIDPDINEWFIEVHTGYAGGGHGYGYVGLPARLTQLTLTAGGGQSFDSGVFTVMAG